MAGLVLALRQGNFRLKSLTKKLSLLVMFFCFLCLNKKESLNLIFDTCSMYVYVKLSHSQVVRVLQWCQANWNIRVWSRERLIAKRGGGSRSEKLLEIPKGFWQSTFKSQVISKIYRQLMQLNTRKINDPIKKWTKELKTDISPKKTYGWLTNTWKDAQHHSLSEKCKLKPQWGTISRWSECLLSKTSTNNKCWRGCGEKGTLLNCRWECKLVQPLWRTVGDSLKNWK